MRVAFSFTNHKKAKHPKRCFAFFVRLAAHENAERCARRQWRDRRRVRNRKCAAQRYAIPSASPPYGLPGAAMIADEKAARQKNHEKQCVFHGFLLFKRQKWAFFEKRAKIRFYGCFFVNYRKNRVWTVDYKVSIINGFYKMLGWRKIAPTFFDFGKKSIERKNPVEWICYKTLRRSSSIPDSIV